jgi:MerR family redox-sensitive transcriptional activator SoxR
VDHGFLTIGEVADRSGVAHSALRFYEERGLVRSERSAGGQRRYHRDVLRRLAFIGVAQHVGLSLNEIGEALSVLPPDRAPTAAQWEKMSTRWRPAIDERIRQLEGLRDQLGSCIGCGCLSLRACPLYNPGDAAGELGPGPRYLLGDSSAMVTDRRGSD